jgi:hypothetical protein
MYFHNAQYAILWPLFSQAAVSMMVWWIASFELRYPKGTGSEIAGILQGSYSDLTGTLLGRYPCEVRLKWVSGPAEFRVFYGAITNLTRGCQVYENWLTWFYWRSLNELYQYDS